MAFTADAQIVLCYASTFCSSLTFGIVPWVLGEVVEALMEGWALMEPTGSISATAAVGKGQRGATSHHGGAVMLLFTRLEKGRTQSYFLPSP